MTGLPLPAAAIPYDRPRSEPPAAAARVPEPAAAIPYDQPRSEPPAAARVPTAAPALSDSFGRVARDLRVSVTDRCNLRCRYCMPAAGVPWFASGDLLTDTELLRLVGVFVDLGIRAVRLTGGEPLLRPGLVEVVRAIAALRSRPTIAMTTNGVRLQRAAGPLADAGLSRVNVSLDAVSPAQFEAVTRRNRFAQVAAGLDAAAAAGLHPVKVNAVVLRGVNDRALPQLLSWCLDRGYELRFVEQLPLDADHAWDRAKLVTAAEIRARLSERYVLTPLAPAHRGSDPAQRYVVNGGPAVVGIVPSVTAPFCGACDRIRLTADGQVRSCLFADEETDLLGPLRQGATDTELSDLVRAAVRHKRAGHDINRHGFRQPARSMSAIGG